MEIMHGPVQLQQKNIFKQKNAASIIFHADVQTRARSLLTKIKARHVYQGNIQQLLTFMQRVKILSVPRVFKHKFLAIHHNYPTRFSKNAFKQTYAGINCDKFWIVFLDPQLWNIYLKKKRL